MELSKELKEKCVLLSSRPCGEAISSIEKIRKRILFHLHPKDLLKSRLVSRAWREDATNRKLLNWNQNGICIEAKDGDTFIHAMNASWNRKFRRPLRELSELMEGAGNHAFPCSNFKFSYGNRNFCDEGFQNFLDAHGARIEMLDLNLFYEKTCREFRQEDGVCPHILKWIIQFLTKLLLKQVPNLKRVCISFFADLVPSHSVKTEINCNALSVREHHVTNPEYALKANDSLQSVLFFCWTGGVREVVKLFCELAPNLKSFHGNDITLLMEPINRLDLLRSITYNPFHHSGPEKYIARMRDPEQLQVDTIDICLDRSENSYAPPADWSDVENIIRKLLEKCSQSLNYLHTTCVGFLPEFKIPQMPNVKNIYFKECRLLQPTKYFFPPGMLFAETFPNLRNIHICGKVEKYLFEGKYLLVFENEVVASVRNVFVEEELLNYEKYKQIFPNATIVKTERGDRK